MPKPITTIAQARQCDEVAARTFYEAVQRCYKGSAPAFRAIAQEVVQAPMATPEEIAARISPNWRIQIAVQSKRSKGKQWSSGHDIYFDDLERHVLPSGWHSAHKNPLRSRNRLEPAKAERCPHGIPFYRKCGICNKEEFQEWTGLG
jgi:hypothetical protein